MRRPSIVDIRSIPVCGDVFADFFEALGIDLSELPDIIPDDVGDPAFQAVLVDLLKSKGWSEEDLRRPLDEPVPAPLWRRLRSWVTKRGVGR